MTSETSTTLSGKGISSRVTACLPLISKQRAHIYSDWLAVGMVLLQYGEPGYDAWHQWSEAAQSRHAPECATMDMHLNDYMWLTDQTLAWFASQDSPDQFKQVQLGCARSAYNKYVTSDQICVKGLSKILYELTLAEYVCVGPNCDLYWFNPAAHRLDDSPFKLHRYISGPFCEILQSFGAPAKILTSCHTIGFKNKLVNKVRERFYVHEAILDTNVPGLFKPASRTGYNSGMMVVSNGVLDFHRRGEDDFFNPGKPENYLTQQAPTLYRSDYRADHPDVVQCHAWLDQILAPANKVKLCRSLYRSLQGTHEDPPAYFWYGPAACGKSSLQRLVEKVLGPYTHRIQVEDCQEKQDQRLRSVRADHVRAIFCEIDYEDQFPERYPGRTIFVTRALPPGSRTVAESHIITFHPPTSKDTATPIPEALLWLIIHTSS